MDVKRVFILNFSGLKRSVKLFYFPVRRLYVKISAVKKNQKHELTTTVEKL